MLTPPSGLGRATFALLLVLFVAPLNASVLATIDRATISAIQLTADSVLRLAALEAMASLEQGDLVMARRQFNAIEASYPDYAGALVGLAEVDLQQDQPEQAIEHARRATEIAPDIPQVWLAFGNVLAATVSLDEADQAYRESITLDPDYAAARLARGNLLLRGFRKPAEALPELKRAVEIDPQLATGFFALGSAHGALGQEQPAVEAFKEAARLAPMDPLPMHTLGRLLAQYGRMAEAESALSQAVKVAPGSLAARLDRGDVFTERGRYAEAMNDYRHVLGYQSDNHQLRMKLALVTQRYGDLDAAAELYRTLITQNDSAALAYNNLAWIEVLQEGDLDDAHGWASKAVELAPEVPQFLDTLAWVERGLQNTSRAMYLLEKAAEIDPPQFSVHYHMGILAQELGDADLAIAQLQRALELDPQAKDSADAKARLQRLR